jgi:hypothetical protein
MENYSIVSRKSQDPIKKVGQVAEKILDGLTVQAPGGHPWGRKPANERELGFYPHLFIMLPFPYQDPKSIVFERQYGDYMLGFMGRYGVPSGKAARCLMAYITTEYKQQENDIKDPERRRMISIGTLRKAANAMGYNTLTGGKNGSATKITKALEQLLFTMIYTKAEKVIGQYKVLAGKNVQLFDDYAVSWNITDKSKESLPDGGWVRISPQFEEVIKKHAAPVDIDVYNSLNARQQDLYGWACRRSWGVNRQHQKEVFIPIDLILPQFFDNVMPETKTRLKRELIRGLVEIKMIYPQFNVEGNKEGLILRPSRLHIPPKSMGYI